jgi:hypothetical protein
MATLTNDGGNQDGIVGTTTSHDHNGLNGRNSDATPRNAAVPEGNGVFGLTQVPDGAGIFGGGERKHCPNWNRLLFCRRRLGPHRSRRSCHHVGYPGAWNESRGPRKQFRRCHRQSPRSLTQRDVAWCLCY